MKRYVVAGLNLKMLREENFLTMDHLDQIFKQNDHLTQYIPETHKFRTLKREYLFNVIHEVDRPLYNKLKQELQDRISNKSKLGAEQKQSLLYNVSDEFKNSLFEIPDLGSKII